jgi:L-threonylcarbamoyladenylate synthase
VPGWITGRHDRIAVRVTAHPQAAALCHAAGMAIISTSANRGGEAPARTDREVSRRFGKLVDFILPGSVGDTAAPTPIRDAISGQLVRPG